jgi:hypothetical protein
MNALIRKELRQILPAQLFLATLFALAGWSMLNPHDVLAPYDENEAWLHAFVACLYLVEGLVLGLGQFAAERWQGTEAYIVHRGTGREGAFRAKALAAIVSLLLLVALPPVAFGIFHLSQQPYAGTASIERLVHLGAAGCTAFAGYGLGALVAQAERPWAVKALLAISGTLSLLLILLVGVLPIGPDAAPSLLRHLLIQLATAGALLWSARHGFVQAPTANRPASRAVACARAALAGALFTVPFVLLPFLYQTAVITQVREREPEIVADEAGALYVARPTSLDREQIGKDVPAVFRHGTVYEITDVQGGPVAAELAVQYTGSFRSERPFFRVFAAHLLDTPKLGQDDPSEAWRGVGNPFAFGGRWIERHVDGFTWCFDRDSGEHWVRRVVTDIFRGIHGEPEPRWHRLDERTPRADVVHGISRMGNAAFVLLTDDGSPPRTMEPARDGSGPRLREVPLPDGDRILGRDLLVQVHSARVGLRGYGTRELIRGEHDRYVWNGLQWVRWSAVEELDRTGFAAADEAQRVQRWTVDVTPIDGLAYGLAVSDVTPNGARIELEVDAATFLHRRVLEAASLTFPPVVAIASWFGPQGAPMRPLDFSVGLDQNRILRGGQGTWILIVVVTVASFLVRDLWRRLLRGGAPLEVRILWCSACALLGLPACIVCRMIEHRVRTRARLTAPKRHPMPHFEICTARAN